MNFERYRRAEGGQAILEVAILAPFLLLLFVGIVDIGRLQHYNEVVGNSARAGAQFGAQDITTAADPIGMSNAGQLDAQVSGHNLTGLTVTGAAVCRCSDGSAATCFPQSTCPNGTHMLTYVSVTSRYPFSTLFNYHFIAQPLALTRTVVMQVAQ